MMLWGYMAQFGDAMVPTNSYDSLAANAQGYAAYDFEVVFEQASATVLPNFETLRNYLTTKALYDGNIDTFAEVDNFINAYYGPAASAMSDYFDAHLENLRTFEAKGNNYKSWAAAQYLNGDYAYSPAIITDNYSKSYVDTCAAYFDTAYAALANAYSQDSAAYKTYKSRLDLEYFGILYLYLELYSEQIAKEQGAQMAQDAARIMAEQSLTAVSTSKINTWRAAFDVVPEKIDYTFFENTVFEDTSLNRNCTFSPYSGVVGGKTIDGVRVTSYDYQPHFNFTEDGVALIKSMAEEQGCDYLVIRSYANLSNNYFVLNNESWVTNSWSGFYIDVDDLSTDFDLWSQGDSKTEIYMTLELVKKPVVDATSFTGSDWTFSNFEGNIGGKDMMGVRGVSHAYQPRFYFTESAIADIKAYAAENGYEALRIGAYAILNDNCLVVNNQMWVVNEWNYLDVSIEDLTTSFEFWSQSGSNIVYLTFEFMAKSVINAGSFTGSSWTFTDYAGNIGGKDIVGIEGVSYAYQPRFYFTESAIADIKAYAAENGYNTLTIGAYAILNDNCLVVNNKMWVVAEWNYLDVNIEDLSTALEFWSQSGSNIV